MLTHARVAEQDYDDDGESAAGGRLLHLLQIVDARNVVGPSYASCGVDVSDAVALV
jgi:hypothetical protein